MPSNDPFLTPDSLPGDDDARATLGHAYAALRAGDHLEVRRDLARLRGSDDQGVRRLAGDLTRRVAPDGAVPWVHGACFLLLLWAAYTYGPLGGMP
ncbi:MAG: hypothetical protein KC417_08755 [Myxococcales bacterium]|nr:hypothetical protein [Myxococcales bacterium]